MMVANSWNLIITVKPANQRSHSGSNSTSATLRRESVAGSGGGGDSSGEEDIVADLTQQHQSQ